MLHGLRIVFRTGKGKEFILEDFVQSTFCGTVLEGLGIKENVPNQIARENDVVIAKETLLGHQRFVAPENTTIPLTDPSQVDER